MVIHITKICILEYIEKKQFHKQNHNPFHHILILQIIHTTI
jgi:hypothetical protein